MKRSSQEITPDDAGAAAAGASAARPEEEGDAAQAAAVGTPEEKTAEETKGVPKDDKEEVEIFCERDALTQTGDDTAFLREMVVESFEEIEERMVELRRIFRDRSDPSPSVASVRGLAHSIKGAAACFAYNRLRNAAKALELHARELESVRPGALSPPEAAGWTAYSPPRRIRTSAGRSQQETRETPSRGPGRGARRLHGEPL
eukprot:scaffold7092_cov262-Pinguiococcus_pyrenoidosus.AAC.57